MLQGHIYGASASHSVSVYVPAVVGTKLYCLVTEAHGCEQLAQGCYPTGLELANIKSVVRYPIAIR